MKKTYLLLLLIVALALAACGGAAAPDSAPKGDATKGAQIYAGTCSACHGPDAKGIVGLGKDLTTSTFLDGLSDADAVAFLKTGRPSSDPLNSTGVDMPPRGGNPALTDDDLLNVVAYLRDLGK